MFSPEVLEIPKNRKTPTTYFVGDMSDIAQENVKDDWLLALWEMMHETRDRAFTTHSFKMLTHSREVPRYS